MADEVMSLHQMVYLALFLAVVAVILGGFGTKAYYDVAHGDDEDQTVSDLTVKDTLKVDGTSTLTGAITASGKITANGGILNKDITVSSNTSTNVDVSSVAGDHKVFLTGTFAADVILPQATAANVGMTIQVFCTVATATSGTIRIGFLDTGSTVMNGAIHLSSTGALMDSIALADAKVVLLDADNVTLAGGAEGSHYIFHYQAANAVHAICNGFVTTGTPALGAGAQSTTGIS